MRHRALQLTARLHRSSSPDVRSPLRRAGLRRQLSALPTLRTIATTTMPDGDSADVRPLAGAALKLADLFAVTTKIGDWVNTIWAVHSGLNLAILGWWITKSTSWSWQDTTVFTVVYVLLMGVNLYAQIRAHCWLDAFVCELKATAEKTPLETTEMRLLLRSLGPTQYWVLYAWHLLVDGFVLWVIWSR